MWYVMIKYNIIQHAEDDIETNRGVCVSVKDWGQLLNSCHSAFIVYQLLEMRFFLNQVFLLNQAYFVFPYTIYKICGFQVTMVI